MATGGEGDLHPMIFGFSAGHGYESNFLGISCPLSTFTCFQEPLLGSWRCPVNVRGFIALAKKSAGSFGRWHQLQLFYQRLPKVQAVARGWNRFHGFILVGVILQLYLFGRIFKAFLCTGILGIACGFSFRVPL